MDWRAVANLSLIPKDLAQSLSLASGGLLRTKLAWLLQKCKTTRIQSFCNVDQQDTICCEAQKHTLPNLAVCRCGRCWASMCLLPGAEGQGPAAPGPAEGTPLQPSIDQATPGTASLFHGELDTLTCKVAACIVQSGLGCYKNDTIVHVYICRFCVILSLLKAWDCTCPATAE